MGIWLLVWELDGMLVKAFVLGNLMNLSRGKCVSWVI
uniref:Uncharacterized protein n=1 Tax=Anguilla anguilla TaxID=7936 RepID=A0A0E9S691_ANGAN